MNEMPASAPKTIASDVNSIIASDAKLLLTSSLSHLSIENSVYWLLDGDDSRIRQVHAQHYLAVLRRMAFDLLPSENSAQIGISAKRERAGWKTDHLPKILSQQDAHALELLRRKIDFPAAALYNWPHITQWQCTGGVPTRADGRETPSWLKRVSVLAAHIRGSGSWAGSRGLMGKVAGKAGSVNGSST